MSLDKAIEHGKERRKPYRGSKAIDHTCRNHGGCLWCEKNRTHKFRDKHPLDDYDDVEETEDELKLYVLCREDENGDMIAQAYAYGEEWVEQALWMNDIRCRTPEEAKEWWEKHGKRR